jgi:hypothetical protein
MPLIWAFLSHFICGGGAMKSLEIKTAAAAGAVFSSEKTVSEGD